ncbi:hypothetical protein J5069_00300 [Candidatus Symbiopectobacterium sp. NZEC127]|uniref:hypothetical protein n=1 Tax=Candidatus Symbiopectobacterium sp. NZEC127 TaxID=2820472 RepID=UPI002225DAFF|nr:hypothetical protein [Candidatus Symbiopectobacterium sp. NZEC127]MCW2484328.1 hypothetical protein [Candidatus Symbiopectobacterium sp. NZEC127]
MPVISTASPLLNAVLPLNAEAEKKQHYKNHSVNSHLVSITSPSDADARHLKKSSVSVSYNLLSWLKAWCPIKNTQKAAENDELSVMGPSLLQQAEAISAQRHEGLAPFSPPPLRLRGKAGWLMGAGILAGATAGTLTLRHNAAHQSSGATDWPAGTRTLAAPGNDSIGEYHHIENIGYFEHIPPALQSANLISESYLHPNEKDHSNSDNNHDIRSGVIGFLKKNNFLDKNVVNNQIKKEVLVSAVAEYIYGDDGDGVKTLANKEISVAKHILAETDLYGGRRGESISAEFSQAVISHWMFNQVLGMYPGEYLADKIKSNDYPSYFTVSSLKYILGLNQIFNDGLLNYQEIPADRWGEFNSMWYLYVEKEIPMLKWPEKNIDKISLGSQVFADLYAGSALLDKTHDLKKFTLNETLQIGSGLWDMVTDQGAGLDNIGYFLLPSLIIPVSNQKKLPVTRGHSFRTQVAAVEDYIHYRKEVMAIQQALTKQFERYTSAVNAWLSKGKLADKIIADCPTSELPGLPDLADGIRSKQQMREKKEKQAKQLYLNEFVKPCKKAPEKLDDEYNKLTREVVSSFQKLDENIIFSSFGTIDRTEADFILSSDVKINPVQFYMRADRPVACVHGVCRITDFDVKLKDTDLFSVNKDNQERIYALKRVMSHSTFSYRLIRVDRDIRKYINNGLLDNGFTKNYVVETDRVIDSDNFNFSITTLRSPIENNNTDAHPLIGYLSKKHSDDFYHQLYASGNDKSGLQKAWGFVKHVIPFYDCIEGIVNNDAAQAVPACMMDIIGLIPVAGQAANMAGKFGTGLAKGLRYGGRSLMRGTVGDAGTVLLKEIRLPHANEFLGLSKSALRAVDPGFELLSKGGKLLDRKLESFLRMKQSSIPLADKMSSFRSVEPLPLTTKAYMTARLPHSEIEVPIQKVGADLRGEYYSLVNPETGGMFGRHYHLLDDGRLKPVATRIHQQKIRQKSTVEINRMDQNHFPMAAHSPAIDITHIPPLRKFLSSSAYLPPHMQFNRAPIVHQGIQRHLSDDFTHMGVELKNFVTTNYNQNDVYFGRFSQTPDEIPVRFAQLKNNLQHYKEGVLLAKHCADALEYEFSRTTMRNIHGELQFAPRGNRIESYLSKVMKLDEIADANIAKIIKKEMMQRLRYHTEKIKDYLNNEIDNIYFASSDTYAHPYVYNPNSPMGFVGKEDTFRRIIIMVDNYHASPLLSTKLHLTALHEASHFSGTLDFQIAPSTSLVGDASEFIETFNDGLLGINNEYVHIDDDFINAYRREFPHIAITEGQFRELLKRDPVLRANAFIENADFLARIISDLASRARHNSDMYHRSRRETQLPRSMVSVLLYRLMIASMKSVTPDAHV